MRFWQAPERGEQCYPAETGTRCFLTPRSEITLEDCPAMIPLLRQTFGCAREALADLVPPELVAHRKMMFERHLTWPIAL